MNAPPIIHSQMLTSLAGFFPSLVSIQARGAGQGELGSPDGAFADVPGLTGLAAAVQSPASTRSRERREAQETHATREREILLAGAYSAITTGQQAVVTSGPSAGLTFDIMAVDLDSQGKLTRLLVEAVA